MDVGRYVERNALRAELVKQAIALRWCSDYRRKKLAKETPWLLSLVRVAGSGAVSLARWVQGPQSDTELAALRQSVVRGSPYGADRWRIQAAVKLNF